MKRDKLIEIRKKQRLTHKAVASAAGISRSYYGHIENGIRNPSYKVASRIADFLKYPIEDLFPDMIFFGNRGYVVKQNDIKTKNTA